MLIILICTLNFFLIFKKCISSHRHVSHLRSDRGCLEELVRERTKDRTRCNMLLLLLVVSVVIIISHRVFNYWLNRRVWIQWNLSNVVVKKSYIYFCDSKINEMFFWIGVARVRCPLPPDARSASLYQAFQCCVSVLNES